MATIPVVVFEDTTSEIVVDDSEGVAVVLANLDFVVVNDSIREKKSSYTYRPSYSSVIASCLIININ